MTNKLYSNKNRNSNSILLNDKFPRKASHNEDCAVPTVLIIDDNDLTIMSLKHQLESQSIYVLGATSGSIAITLLANIKVDLVVLDYNMPEDSGLEVLKAIRAQFPGLEVIIYSGCEDKKIEKRIDESRCRLPDP